MLGQLNLAGKDMVEVAIERLKTFEPPEGYYLAFSGGKDSVVIKRLAEMAGVKFDAHYGITTVDPPELVKFVKSMPDVQMDKARYDDGSQITMWNLIPRKKMPPTRVVRYCCRYLKEGHGNNRFVVTGVRWGESKRRKANRGGVEISKTRFGKVEFHDPDNPSQELIHICPTMSKRILNPIIDWSDSDVWEFIKKYDVPYCKLYDQGFKRLGCIGCPMAGVERQRRELERYPKFKNAYLHAFERMINEREEIGLDNEWETGEDVMKWWIGDDGVKKGR